MLGNSIMSAYHVRKDTHGFQRLQLKNSFADLDSQSSTERTAMIDNLLPRDAPADENSAPATMFATHDVLAMNEQVAGNDGGWGDQRKSKAEIVRLALAQLQEEPRAPTHAHKMSPSDASLISIDVGREKESTTAHQHTALFSFSPSLTPSLSYSSAYADSLRSPRSRLLCELRAIANINVLEEEDEEQEIIAGDVEQVTPMEVPPDSTFSVQQHNNDNAPSFSSSLSATPPLSLPQTTPAQEEHRGTPTPTHTPNVPLVTPTKSTARKMRSVATSTPPSLHNHSYTTSIASTHTHTQWAADLLGTVTLPLSGRGVILRSKRLFTHIATFGMSKRVRMQALYFLRWKAYSENPPNSE